MIVIRAMTVCFILLIGSDATPSFADNWSPCPNNAPLGSCNTRTEKTPCVAWWPGACQTPAQRAKENAKRVNDAQQTNVTRDHRGTSSNTQPAPTTSGSGKVRDHRSGSK